MGKLKFTWTLFWQGIIAFCLVLLGELVNDMLLSPSGYCGSSIVLCRVVQVIVFIIILLVAGVLAYIIWKLMSKIAKQFSKFKYSFQRKKEVDFSPYIYRDGNIIYMKISCPQKSFLYAVCSYSVKYLKSKREDHEIKTKSDLINKMISDAMIGATGKQSSWFDYDSIKIKKNTFGRLHLFEIDPDKEIFCLYRDSGMPKRFRNDELFPNLEEISFQRGEYDFEITISARDFLGRVFMQRFPYHIIYEG